MQHKTRKQLRQDSEAVAAELAALKSPEGLARFIFSKGDDEEFETAFRAEIEKLSSDARLAAEGAEEDAQENVDPETVDSSLKTQESNPKP